MILAIKRLVLRRKLRRMWANHDLALWPTIQRYNVMLERHEPIPNDATEICHTCNREYVTDGVECMNCGWQRKDT